MKKSTVQKKSFKEITKNCIKETRDMSVKDELTYYKTILNDVDKQKMKNLEEKTKYMPIFKQIPYYKTAYYESVLNDENIKKNIEKVSKSHPNKEKMYHIYETIELTEEQKKQYYEQSRNKHTKQKLDMQNKKIIANDDDYIIIPPSQEDYKSFFAPTSKITNDNTGGNVYYNKKGLFICHDRNTDKACLPIEEAKITKTDINKRYKIFNYKPIMGYDGNKHIAHYYHGGFYGEGALHPLYKISFVRQAFSDVIDIMHLQYYRFNDGDNNIKAQEVFLDTIKEFDKTSRHKLLNIIDLLLLNESYNSNEESLLKQRKQIIQTFAKYPIKEKKANKNIQFSYKKFLIERKKKFNKQNQFWNKKYPNKENYRANWRNVGHKNPGLFNQTYMRQNKLNVKQY